jgi:hypothetical protein
MVRRLEGRAREYGGARGPDRKMARRVDVADGDVGMWGGIFVFEKKCRSGFV